ncbi:MAG: hypothetical protein K9J85_03295 [Desulfobacteraceae bacterium]|nr:hypothetical protein [Desulfobacteraceae bacterium]
MFASSAFLPDYGHILFGGASGANIPYASGKLYLLETHAGDDDDDDDDDDSSGGGGCFINLLRW